MSASVKKKKRFLQAEVLLAIGGLFLFGFMLFHVEFPVIGAVFSSEIPEDSFLRGEYYFNHDDDPSGPYDLVRAREAYMEALEKDPRGNNLVWYQLGRIDFLEGKFISALYKFDKQVEYFGDEIPNVHYMIGLTSGFKGRISNDATDWENAENGFKRYLLHEPASPWAHTDLAWVYFAQGRYDEMFPVLEEGLVTDPEHPWLLNMYGLALLNTGKLKEAHEYFLHAERQASKLSVAQWGKAYPGNNPDDWASGLQSFKEAISKNIELSAKASMEVQN